MISTWLYRIAMNEALMLLRERRSNIISTEENEDEMESLNHYRL